MARCTFLFRGLTLRALLVVSGVGVTVACSDASTEPPAVTPSATEPGPISPREDGGTVPGDASLGADVAAPAALPPSTGGKGGLTCTSRATVSGRSICTAKVGTVELKFLLPQGGSGPLRLGVYMHGDGAGAHKSGSIFTPMSAWADKQHGLAVSFLAPNGCAWWQAPKHDCASQQVDADADGANTTALVTAFDAIMKAFDVRTDGIRYYGSSGGSIFLTDEWIPLQGGRYPGVFALMCGGDASTRTYTWDTTNASLRSKSPLWFTYGDQDFLLTEEKASVAAFKAKGFAVTERVIPNAGHCAFDAHGEAFGIWAKNP